MESSVDLYNTIQHKDVVGSAILAEGIILQEGILRFEREQRRYKA
jgi:hypothetical protein